MMRGTLSILRQNFVYYYENPERFLDMSTLELQYDSKGGAVYQVRGRSFGEVTGIPHLGSGAYADVYGIDSRRVLKVIKSEDEGYARFVSDVVRKLPNNPFLPRIYYQGTWGPKQVYILERLTGVEHWEDSQWAKDNGFVYDDDTWGGRNKRREAMRVFIAENQAKYDADYERNNRLMNINNSFRDAVHRACENDCGNNPFYSMSPEIVAIGKLLNDSNTCNDLHSGNVMFRGDTPVITDPAT